MTLDTKRFIIGGLGLLFLFSLVLVQWTETIRRAEEAGLRGPGVTPPASSRGCVDCHAETNPGIVDHWRGSTHAARGVGCVECHRSVSEEPDSYIHYGAEIATVVTPRDCASCHATEADEFAQSHHAAGGNILASLDNFLAETVEGSRVPVRPAHADAGSRTRAGQRARERVLRVPAVSWLEGRPPGHRRRHDHCRRPAARRRWPADQPGRGLANRPQRQRSPVAASGHLAEHRHRPAQSRWVPRVLHRVPQSPRLLAPPRAAARKLW